MNVANWPNKRFDRRMKAATIFVRILLGLVFVVFGLNGFFHFIPLPKMSGHPADFMGAMAATGYLRVIQVLQIVGGVLLLLGRFVPLGLTLLGPIVVNIVLFHVFMDRAGLPMAIGVAACSLFLLFSYRSSFAGILRA